MTREIEFAFLLFVMSAVSGCAYAPATEPLLFQELAYGELRERTYLWTSGIRADCGEFWDSAHITEVNGVAIPEEYIPVAGASYSPRGNRLLELPAGELVVNILYKEDTYWTVVNVLFGGGDAVFVERAEGTVSFVGAVDRVYAPFAGDRDSSEYFWLEDIGSYAPGSADYGGPGSPAQQSNERNPVVAGERPPSRQCNAKKGPAWQQNDY